MATAPLPSIRILAYAARNVQHLRTVNVLASAPNDPHHSIKPYIQLTAAQFKTGVHEQVMASGAADAVTKGLPTIYVNGYSAPS